MATAPAISIGDLVRAVGTLGVNDPATTDRIARLLGIRPGTDVASAAAVATPSVVQPKPPAEASRDTSREDPRTTASAPQSPAPALPPDAPSRSIDLDELPADRSPHRPPRAVPPLAQLLATPSRPNVPVDTSLFVSRWERGIVTAAISTQSGDGPVDIARVVDDIANGRAVQRLPRLPIHTTRKGLQVLIDIADGMRPFANDVTRLERLLRFTAGDDGVRMLRFDRTPADGVGRGTRRTWTSYAPPPAGTPVLVISDFSLARSAPPTLPIAWQKVASVLRPQQSPLLALTPFPSSRWPRWLLDLCSPIQWDRPTNAAAARRAAERGARR